MLASQHVGIYEIKRPFLVPLHPLALEERAWTLFHGEEIPTRSACLEKGTKIIKTATTIHDWSWSEKPKTEWLIFHHCREYVMLLMALQPHLP